MNLPTYIAGSTQSKAYRLLREYVYEALGEYDLKPSYWTMLGLLAQAKDGIRQVEIAHEMHVKAPLVTAMAKHLQDRQLVQSVQNQFDARAKLLALTPAGKKFVKMVEADLNRSLMGLLSGLTELELQAYFKVLQTIIANDEKLRQQ